MAIQTFDAATGRETARSSRDAKSMIKILFRACATAVLLAAMGAAEPALAQADQSPAASAHAAQLDPAAKQIQDFYGALSDSMKHAKALGVSGRYEKLAPAAAAAFDFPTMTKMTVGPDWESMSQADQSALTSAFRRLTVADYARNFDGYNGEEFVVDSKVQERDGDKIVSSKMTAPGKDPIPFVYRMQKTADGWQIIDVYLNGYVSEVATRRADFASTLKSGGASALVKKLDVLTDNILKGK